MAAIVISVKIDTYLNTTYSPDVEYVDGQLEEKPVVAPIHACVQTALAIWFGQYEEQWQIQTVASGYQFSMWSADKSGGGNFLPAINNSIH